MRPSLIVSLLLLSNLLYVAQGIRLGKESLSAGHHGIQEDHRALIKRSNGGVGEFIMCKDGQCSGMNRKLIAKTTSTSSTSTTSTNYKNDGNKAHDPLSKGNSRREGLGRDEENFSVNSSSVSKHGETAPEGYSDILDIVGMDYSPAKRKPPIHN